MRSGFSPQTVEVAVGTATVDGVPRDVTSVSTVREIGGAGVPGLRAVAAAEGSVEFGQLVNATSAPAYSPWTRVGNWPPAPGSAVQVDTGSELESFRALTGVIDASSPGPDGIITSDVMDPVDRLHRRITLQSILASMPPLELGGPLRNVGNSSDFIADTLLRRCAYFSTPYMPGSMKGVNVTGQGSVWPERGTCVDAGQRTDTNLAADFLSSEWGWGIYDCDASYTTEGTLTAASGVELACMVSDSHAANAVVSIAANGHRFDLVVWADRSVSARHHDGTGNSIVATLPAASGWRRVVVRVSAGSMWVGTDDGRAASGAHTALSPVTTAPVSAVRIEVTRGGRIGGVIVADLPAGNYFGQALNARLYAGTALNPKLVASKRIEQQDALSALSEIADATCRAFWWDEDGVFQWMPGDFMLARNPVHTIRSRDSLLDLGWSEALADVSVRVVVDHKTPSVARSRTPNVPVWQGKGASIESGQTEEEIATPGADEEWIQTQWSPQLANTFINDHNHGRFSVWGGVLTDGTATSWAGGYLTTSLQFIGGHAVKYTYTAGPLPTGESIQLAFPNGDAITSVWQRWRNEKLPILRAYGRVDWGDGTYVAGSGPVAAAEYQHDGGKWVQGYAGESPQRVADFLAAWLTVPRINATNVRVVHDPRIQVGDVITVRDEHAHGVELKVLVTRVKQTISPRSDDMVLDFFVIDGGPAFMTLGEHNAAQSGTTLSAHDTAQDGESLGEHDADPRHTD